MLNNSYTFIVTATQKTTEKKFLCVVVAENELRAIIKFCQYFIGFPNLYKIEINKSVVIE